MDEQEKEFEQSNRQEIPSPPKLQPVEKMLEQQGYPPPAIENYSKLIPKEFHLSELYLLGCKYSPGSPAEKKKRVNPIQAKVDTKGRIWVDVIFERKKGVKIQDLKMIMRVHGKPRQSRIITGRIKVDNLPDLEKLTMQLQTAKPISPTLNESKISISADRQILSSNGFGDIDGSGVIVGIIDTGCDFKLSNFRKVNKKTRLLSLWDQNGKIGPGKNRPNNYTYGVEYTENQLNTILNNNVSYKSLGYDIKEGAHGTYVMDIAAGNSKDGRYKGVAPGASLIFVHLGKPGPDTVDKELKTLGSSNYLYDAVSYIFDKANTADTGEKMPVVINISLGASGGAHDGNSLVETRFDELLKISGRAIVIAAGNDYLKQLHTSGKVSPNKETNIYWTIHQIEKPEPSQMRQELEIWYPKGTSLNVEIIDPNQVNYGICHLGDSPKSSDTDEVPLVLVKHLAPELELSKTMNHIDILVDNGKSNFVSGEWTVRLTQDDVQTVQNLDVEFQAWIERNGQEDKDRSSKRIGSEFSKDIKKESTLNGLANAALPIVVGSCTINEETNSFDASYFTSAGPTFNKKNNNKIKKPELCAPGENIFSAEALTDGRFSYTGTSVAAPHVTGAIALIFQRAKLLSPNSNFLTITQIRNILINSADPHTTGGELQHDYQLGFGRVNALNALTKLE